MLTHEHTDHNWGVNALREHFTGVKLACSEECNKRANKYNKIYFLFYFNRKDYKYEMALAEYVIHSDSDVLGWNGCQISFAMTPGHSRGSMCIYIDGMLFTGDTIMPYKPYFNGRDSNEDDWKSSIEKVLATYPANTLVYPGYGEVLARGMEYCVLHVDGTRSSHLAWT